MRRRRVLGGLVALVLLARARRWSAVRVAGDSMVPALRAGDLLAVRPLRANEPKVGQIVVARQGDREVVKRVGGLPPDHTGYWLEGDNAAASTDSRMSGAVQREDITGVVRARYWPLRGIRRVG